MGECLPARYRQLQTPLILQITQPALLACGDWPSIIVNVYPGHYTLISFFSLEKWSFHCRSRSPSPNSSQQSNLSRRLASADHFEDKYLFRCDTRAPATLPIAGLKKCLFHSGIFAVQAALFVIINVLLLDHSLQRSCFPRSKWPPVSGPLFRQISSRLNMCSFLFFWPDVRMDVYPFLTKRKIWQLRWKWIYYYTDLIKFITHLHELLMK